MGGPVISTMTTPAEFSAFPWMKFALLEYGQHEIRGRRENPHIQRYFASINIKGASDEVTAWCSAFANWCMQQSGIVGSGRGNARSWLHWGNQSLARPTYGAITVLWRLNPKGWQGHVAFYVGEAGSNLLLLGGNQGKGEVSIKPYPKAHLLGYRWPAGRALPEST
jgi:uncharacterized protein (TIGR02594 family)